MYSEQASQSNKLYPFGFDMIIKFWAMAMTMTMTMTMQCNAMQYPKTIQYRTGKKCSMHLGIRSYFVVIDKYPVQ